MRLLGALPLALSACGFYVDLPLGEDPDAIPADAAIITPDAASWDTGSCATAPVCPPASPGKVSVCGRVIDVGDEQASLGDQPALWCDPDAPTGAGACSIRVRLHNALPYVSNPIGPPPLQPLEAGLDGCGRFFARDLPEPELGYLALEVDDADGNVDARVPTWIALPLTSGQSRRVDAYTQTRALDAQWTATAGLAAPSFAERGALLLLFRKSGDMAAGVQITENGAVEPANDYYFADADPATRLTVSPALAETGADGAALKIDSLLVNHSGTGAEGPACSWETELSASVPGTLHVGGRRCL